MTKQEIIEMIHRAGISGLCPNAVRSGSPDRQVTPESSEEAVPPTFFRPLKRAWIIGSRNGQASLTAVHFGRAKKRWLRANIESGM